ncbi:PTS lactose/cellobiose transporter subunit IIA [Alkalicella caledoniensis]|uniref:PTS lactose/cellobiose transporter subunit IIA n=1 Tax=Alkalicella caledoniensis TaxID=2731377 RepID=UPI0031B635FE
MEMVAMEIILYSGNSRSEAFQALKFAKEGKFEEAQESLKLAKEEALKAHKVQTNLIQEEARGNKAEIGLLLVHAQDHLMTSMLAKDLIEEMIDLYKNKNN